MFFLVDVDVILFVKEFGIRMEWYVIMWREKYIMVIGNKFYLYKEILFIIGNIV